mgnify:CR=1 FL=1
MLGSPTHRTNVESIGVSKRRALPMLGADGISSVAYAPDEIVLMLAFAGVSGLVFSPWVAFGIAITLLIVVGTFRYNISQISERGGYMLVHNRLGSVPSMVHGASSMVDYLLTVAVSIASGTTYLMSVFPALQPYNRLVALGLLAIITFFCLRGLHAMGRVAPLPTYAFLALLGITLVAGFIQHSTGTLARAESSRYGVIAQGNVEHLVTGFGLTILLARAFSSGAVAITGISTINNSMKFFASPKKRNAARTLMILGLISATLMVGIMYLVKKTGAVVVQDPQRFLMIDGVLAPEGFQQVPLLYQITDTIFRGSFMPALLAFATVGILLMAALTAFIGFPILTSTIAEHQYLPVQLSARYSRRLFANAVIILSLTAAALILIFGTDVNSLIQLYIVGAFTAMSLTQSAVLRHRYRSFRLTLDVFARRKLMRDLAVTTLGLTVTLMALTVVLLTKLSQGAWITLILIAATVGMMLLTRKHYDTVDKDLKLDSDSESLAAARVLPARVHAIIFVPRVRKPVARAVAYARASRPSSIEAIAVNVVEERTKAMTKKWEELAVPVPLTVLDSPYRDQAKPVIEYVRRKKSESPEDVTVIYLPEYVVNHWWEALIHRRTVHHIAAQLRRETGVVIASVPWNIGQDRLESPSVSRSSERVR